MPKDGRPHQKLAAIHVLSALADLSQRFPSVAALQRAMMVENVSRDDIEEALKAACEEISDQAGRVRLNIDKSSPEAELLSLAHALQAAIQDASLLRHLSTVISTASDHAETSVATIKNLIWAAVVRRPSIPAHVQMTAEALTAAGLTTSVSRGISASQLDRIAAILNEDRALPQAMPSGESSVSLAWQANNPWVTLDRDFEGYRFQSRPVSASEHGLLAVLDVGLPPFKDLADFNLPLPMTAFNEATTNGAKASQCWKLIEKWLREHNVRGSFDEGTAIRRKRAWVFLFSLIYGFNAGERQFDKVQFPSPWEADKVVVAERI